MSWKTGYGLLADKRLMDDCEPGLAALTGGMPVVGDRAGAGGHSWGMSKPINLRQYRKRKARDEKAREAEANRVVHGTPKAVRELEAARRAQLAKNVDGHRLESGSETPDGDDKAG